MLDDNIKTQLKAYFEKLIYPIEITISTNESDPSKEMLAMLRDVESLSPMIHVTEKTDGSGRKPSFAINRKGEQTGIVFAGIPMGHEFTSFVLALLQTGGHPPKADPEVIEQIKNLDGPLHFETYISLSCQNCPEVVQALNLMAVLNPRISHTMIDGGIFSGEIAERKIMGVPTVYLNSKELSTGRMTVKDILALIDTAGAEKEAKKISEKPPFDVVVIGGGPAAASAAIYAARKGIRTGLVTENFGGQMLKTTTIENIIAIKETDGMKFAAILEDNVVSNGVDIMMPQRVTRIIPGELLEIQMESGAVIKSKTLVLAPGANYRRLNIEGEDKYIGRGIAFCAHCDGPLYKDKHVAVIGGGNSAIEAAIDLAGIAKHVTVMIRSEVKADTVLQEKIKELPNVTFKLKSQPTEIVGEKGQVQNLVYRDLTTDAQHHLSVDGIFIQIGQQPATDWLKDLVKLNDYGEIVINEYGQTSVPNIFAAGDATSLPYKQIVIAMGSGATAALSAFDYLLRR